MTIKRRQNKITEVDAYDLVRTSMHDYAIEVITERAIPDVYDGLKPVQRRIIYAASKILHDFKMSRTARIVGEVIGKYHPHGDAAVQDAIRIMINHTTPTIRGEGNWGSPIDSPAAMRYTSCGLTAYGRLMVDPVYMHNTVTSYVPNYEDNDIEPVVLPSPLPNIIINGGSGVAVGATTCLPAFTVQSVIKLLIMLLSGKKLTPVDYARTLKPAFNYQVFPVNTKENKAQWLRLFTHTSARVIYQTEFIDEGNRFVIDNWPPEADILKIIATIRNMPEVASIQNSKDTVTYTGEFRKGYSEEEYEKCRSTIDRLLTKAVNYKLNVVHKTITANGYTTELQSLTVVQMVDTWLQFRLQVEAKALKYRISKLQEQLDYTQLIIYAASILDVIRAAWVAPDFITYLSKHGRMTIEQAKIIGGIRVQTLSKLDIKEWKAKEAAQRKEMQQLQKWLKQPKTKLLQDIMAIEKRLITPPLESESQDLKLA